MARYENKGGRGNVSHPALRSEQRSDSYEQALRVRETAEVPPVPSHLGPIGQDVWQFVWSFGGEFYTPENDLLIITRYCELHERREKLLASMDELGWMVEGQRGESKINPLFRALSDAEAQLLQIEKKMGLTPEDRIRLGLAKMEEKDAFEDWLKKQEDK